MSHRATGPPAARTAPTAGARARTPRRSAGPRRSRRAGDGLAVHAERPVGGPRAPSPKIRIARRVRSGCPRLDDRASMSARSASSFAVSRASSAGSASRAPRTGRRATRGIEPEDVTEVGVRRARRAARAAGMELVVVAEADRPASTRPRRGPRGGRRPPRTPGGAARRWTSPGSKRPSASPLDRRAVRESAPRDRGGTPSPKRQLLARDPGRAIEANRTTFPVDRPRTPDRDARGVTAGISARRPRASPRAGRSRARPASGR